MCQLCKMGYGGIDHDDIDSLLDEYLSGDKDDDQAATNSSTSWPGSYQNSSGTSWPGAYGKPAQQTQSSSGTTTIVFPNAANHTLTFNNSKGMTVMHPFKNEPSSDVVEARKRNGECIHCGDAGEWITMQLTCRNGHGRICG